MKAFFVKMKAWHLALLFAIAYLLPIVISLSIEYMSLDAPGSDFGVRSMFIFFRALGMIAILVSLVLFFWKWSIGHYLYDLLPDKEGINFGKYKLSLIINLVFGIIWGVLFFTGFILVLLLATGDIPYLFFLLLLLFAVNVFVFARINQFPYLASKSILQELPYRAITFTPTFIRFVRAIELQKEINEIYSRFGTAGKVDQKTFL